MNIGKQIVIKKRWIELGLIIFIALIVLIGLFSGQKDGFEPVKFYNHYKAVNIGEGITFFDIFYLIVIGFISGTIGGMLGMGGGVLKVSNLHLLFGYEMIFARAVSLLSYVAISISAYFRYKKYNFILWNVVKMLIPSAILGALIGVILGNIFNERIIEIFLGLYALFSGIIVLNHIWTEPFEKEIEELPKEAINETAVSAIGMGMGFISSIIGISGGVLSTPLQESILKIPLKNAIANSVTAAIFCSFTASVLIIWTALHNGYFSISKVLLVTLCLIPGNIAGGQVGSYLTKRLSLIYIRVLFAIMAFIIGFIILV